MDNETLRLKLEANSAKIGMVQAQSQTLAWQLEALKAERKQLEDMLPKEQDVSTLD